MWRITSPFSRWVLPLRVFGVAVFLFAFVKMLVAPDLTLLVITIVGALLWQAGTAAEEQSALYRRLESTAVKDMMRTLPVRVRSWTSVSRFRNEHAALGGDAFIIATQDGYDAGVLTPEELGRVSDNIAAYTSISQLAHPLTYVDGLRVDDPLLEAFIRLKRGPHALLPILGGGDAVAGVITAQDIERWLHKNGGRGPNALKKAGENPAQAVTNRLAA
jgi:hypothetical protein